MTNLTVKREYMGAGNTPPVKDGKFPVLELSDGSRVVGREKQSFDQLHKEAVRLGLIAKPEGKRKA